MAKKPSSKYCEIFSKKGKSQYSRVSHSFRDSPTNTSINKSVFIDLNRDNENNGEKKNKKFTFISFITIVGTHN